MIQAPSNIISDNTVLVTPVSIVADAAGNIYVINGAFSEDGVVLIYNPTATGKTVPTVITGSNTGMHRAAGIALDNLGNIYLGNYDPATSTGSIVFAAGSRGNVAPIRTISGSNTLLGRILDLHLDKADRRTPVSRTSTLFRSLACRSPSQFLVPAPGGERQN